MHVTMTLDKKDQEEAVRRALSAANKAAVGAVGAMALQLGVAVQTLAPVDTGRFRNATLMGLNDVIRASGSGRTFVTPPLKGSRFKDAALRSLTKQIKWLEFLKRSMESEGRAFYKTKRGVGETKGYRRVKRDLDNARRYLAEYRQGLSTGAGAATINLFRSGGNLARAYATVYGGEGAIVMGPGGTGMTLRNKEPHAIIVERKHKTMALSLRALAGGSGRFGPLVKVKGAYMEAITAAWNKKTAG